MSFSKHKGCVIADLPGNYLNWYAREGFPKGEIGRLLALMQETDQQRTERYSAATASTGKMSTRAANPFQPD